MKRTNGNPSTPGAGLGTLMKREAARREVERRKAVQAANRKAIAAMAKGI